MGFDDNIYLTDFWGKDTENFQRILQDAITDYGLGRKYLTQPNYYQPQQPYYSDFQNQTEQRYGEPIYIKQSSLQLFDRRAIHRSRTFWDGLTVLSTLKEKNLHNNPLVNMLNHNNLHN